jgi:hypothetical protein
MGAPVGQVTQLLFRNLEARRLVKLEPRPVQVRIDNNLMVTLVRATGPETCQVEFNYTATYGNLGFIKIEGEFNYAGPQAAQCAKDWEEKRQMGGEIASEIHTSIMHACIPEAVTLARSIQLPPPIPLPVVRFDKPQPAGAPEKGPSFGANPEVA